MKNLLGHSKPILVTLVVLILLGGFTIGLFIHSIMDEHYWDPIEDYSEHEILTSVEKIGGLPQVSQGTVRFVGARCYSERVSVVSVISWKSIRSGLEYEGQTTANLRGPGCYELTFHYLIPQKVIEASHNGDALW